MLNKKKGNMYNFVTHTWNPIKGKCFHDCSYCYMKRWGKQNPIRLDEKEFKTKIGIGKTIFVGSSTDMWADNVPSVWIQKVLDYCDQWQESTYLFQTKNPARYLDFDIPDNFILGTTIESDKMYLSMGGTPYPYQRAEAMSEVKNKKFLTIEPILEFDVSEFSEMIIDIKPNWINIGADSCGHKLPEPPKEKIEELIEVLTNSGIKNIKLKSNIKRISPNF